MVIYLVVIARRDIRDFFEVGAKLVNGSFRLVLVNHIVIGITLRVITSLIKQLCQ